ncbi:hypothetical protein Mag101_07085 [Microbulbifer agarilyticus]|uniref:Uncharacterized protein n=1 Tax=Microbulbifer agarilyticus TaxID=260552 RepID=A0A1Q2M445_9GAMM|nr:hypothetical protein [Microbulbifer agarilyticus]AQQ67426.1 hypothetical protein Mag101_07085 [Microbulbifer agarilyticus]
MIVFTLTNSETDEVWVGTARDGVTPEARFRQIQDAVALGIDHPFYHELKAFGAHAFEVELFAAVEDRLEQQEMVEEALDTYNAKSLVGIKTVRSGTTKAALAPKPKARPRATASKTVTKVTAKRTTKPAKEKIATGRTGSAARERAIKAGIEAEKAAIAAAKAKRVQDEADEMKKILAALDSRGSSMARR